MEQALEIRNVHWDTAARQRDIAATAVLRVEMAANMAMDDAIG